MSDDKDIMEFGFDDAEHIKAQGMEKWKMEKSGQKVRMCIISFNRYHDVVLRQKTREKGESLADEEKQEIIAKVDAKIAEKLGKTVDDLSEIDRLDIKSPKFWNSYCHYDAKPEDGGSGIGTFRCLSKRRGNNIVQREICCKKFNEADQKVACAIMTYPVDKVGNVDIALLKEQKYTEFFIWTLSTKKFKKVEACYAEARADDKSVVDLKVELDGDSKYQKQLITTSSTSVWAKDDFDAEIREWILEQGIRASKHMNSHLGYKLTKEKLMEKMSGNNTVNSIASGAAGAAAPQLAGGYDELLS